MQAFYWFTHARQQPLLAHWGVTKTAFTAFGTVTSYAVRSRSHFTGKQTQQWALEDNIVWVSHLPCCPTAAGVIERHLGLLNQGQLRELGGQWSFKWSKLLLLVLIILNSCPCGMPTPYLNSQQMMRPPTEAFLSLLVYTPLTPDTTQLPVLPDTGALALPSTEREHSSGTFAFPFPLVENPELSHFLLDPHEDLTWANDSPTIFSLCSLIIQQKPSKPPPPVSGERGALVCCPCPLLHHRHCGSQEVEWNLSQTR